MSVVRQWILQMRQQACDKILTQFLHIAESMLKTVPEECIYSWEAELDLMELTCARESEHTDLEIQRANVYTPEKKQQAEPQTALHRASIIGKKGRIIALLEARWSAEVKDTAGNLAWQFAERNGHPELRNILIWNSQEERINDSLFVSGFPANPKGSKQAVLTQDEDGLTLLHWAARRSNVDACRDLVMQFDLAEADLICDRLGETPLHHVAEKASVELVTFLVQASPDLRAAPSLKDSSGKTPLHWAAQTGTKEVVEILLQSTSSEQKRDLLEDLDDNLNSPLHLAIRHDNGRVKEVLEAPTNPYS